LGEKEQCKGYFGVLYALVEFMALFYLLGVQLLEEIFSNLN